ncbi:Transmembrane protein [Alkalicoccus chagannorensis]
MGTLAAVLIIFAAVLIDFYWLDRDKKRWGWMSHWSNYQKAGFFSAFLLLSAIAYTVLSLSFL